MIALLGNFSGTVKPWYLPSDWVFVRIIKRRKPQLSLARNPNNVPNVYGLMVRIRNGQVVKYIPEEWKKYE